MVFYLPVDQSRALVVRDLYSLRARVAQASSVRVSYSEAMSCLRSWVGGGLIGLLGSACSGSESRPEAAGDCNDDQCVGVREYTPPTTGMGAGGSGTAAGSSGGASGGGSGGSGMGLVGQSVLQGTVTVVAEVDLRNSGRPSTSAQVQTEGSGVPARTTEVQSDGGFQMDGVSANRPLWVSVGSLDSSSDSPFISTLQLVTTPPGQAVELRVVERQVMNQIASSSFLNTDTNADPNLAHAILNLVTEGGDPVDGATLTSPVLTVAYDAGVIYSDVVDATSGRGAVVVLNAAADPYPGTTTSVVFDIGGQVYDFDIQLARGSVTLATLEWSP